VKSACSKFKLWPTGMIPPTSRRQQVCFLLPHGVWWLKPFVTVVLVKFAHVMAGLYMYAITFNFQCLIRRFTLHKLGVRFKSRLRVLYHCGKAKLYPLIPGRFESSESMSRSDGFIRRALGLRGMSLVCLTRYHSAVLSNGLAKQDWLSCAKPLTLVLFKC
jgi:hypothetical protein